MNVFNSINLYLHLYGIITKYILFDISLISLFTVMMLQVENRRVRARFSKEVIADKLCEKDVPISYSISWNIMTSVEQKLLKICEGDEPELH